MKLNKIGLKWKIFAYFLFFATLIIICTWLFQTFFFNYFYSDSKKRSCYNLSEQLEVVLGSTPSIESLKDKTHTLDSIASLSENSEVDLVLSYLEMNGDIVVLYSSNDAEMSELHNELARRWKKTLHSGIEGRFMETEGNLLKYDALVFCGRQNVLITLTTSLAPSGNLLLFMRTYLIFLIVITALLAVGFATFVSSDISTPISALNKAAKELAKGNYQAKFKGYGYNEIQELSESLTHAAEELGKLDKYQKDLIANVSHDLRTPLTLITGYSEMMKDLPDEMNPENLQVIIDESKRLTRLVNDILLLTKLQSSTEEFKFDCFSLTDSVNEIIYRNNKLVAQLGIEMEFIYDKNVDVNGDEEKISKVLYNFISNAINYVGEDKKVIVKQTINDNVVRISVIDHGIGINPEHLNDVWNRYYKENKNHKRASSGSGLGLSIVKGILENHHLKYGVNSTINEGSEFWFEMEIID